MRRVTLVDAVKSEEIVTSDSRVAQQTMRQPYPIFSLEDNNPVYADMSDRVSTRYMPVIDMFKNIPSKIDRDFVKDELDGWDYIRSQRDQSNGESYDVYGAAFAYTPEIEKLIRIPIQSLLDQIKESGDLADTLRRKSNRLEDKLKLTESDLKDSINKFEEYKNMNIFLKIWYHFFN